SLRAIAADAVRPSARDRRTLFLFLLQQWPPFSRAWLDVRRSTGTIFHHARQGILLGACLSSAFCGRQRFDGTISREAAPGMGATGLGSAVGSNGSEHFSYHGVHASAGADQFSLVADGIESERRLRRGDWLARIGRSSCTHS